MRKLAMYINNRSMYQSLANIPLKSVAPNRFDIARKLILRTTVLLIRISSFHRSSLCTLTTPFAAKMSPVLMVIVRFLVGFLASVNWPALLHLLSEWASAQD
ncbi:hypothetical protein ACOME3_003342 [Neoechinorhynchus agilis]